MIKQSKLKIALSTILLTFAGCQSTPDHPVDMHEALDQAIAETKILNSPKPLTQVPSSVQQELMLQSMSQAKQGLLSEKRLEISATSVAAKIFFTALVEGSSYSIAIHPDVSGDITLNLTDVTLTEAVGVIEDIYGFDIRTKGNIIQVFPAGIRTETIALNYLFLKRFGTSSTRINSGGVSENDPNQSGNNSNNGNNGNSSRGSSSNSRNSNNNQNNQNNQNGQVQTSGINIFTSNESDFWAELKETLTAFVGKEDGRSVIISPQAGLVTVRGFSEKVHCRN